MISVILPTYCECQNISELVPQIHASLFDAGLEHEILVIDDASPDGTAAAVEALADRFPVRLHVRQGERGLASAVAKGFTLARGDILVVMDADGSHPVSKLPEMVRPILLGLCDATVGSRYLPGGGCENWPRLRLWLSRAAGWLARGVCTMSDPTSGFMAIRADLLNGVHLNPRGWKIVLEVLTRTNANTQEIPITFEDRRHGRSKLDSTVHIEYLKQLWELYDLRTPTLLQFLRFCAVGVLGVAVDTAILMLLVELSGMDPRLAAVPAFLGAVTSNYILNRNWTFRDLRSPAAMNTYLRFAAVCTVGLALRVAVMHLLLSRVEGPNEYWYVTASLCGIVTATVINFLGAKHFAFREIPPLRGTPAIGPVRRYFPPAS